MLGRVIPKLEFHEDVNSQGMPAGAPRWRIHGHPKTRPTTHLRKASSSWKHLNGLHGIEKVRQLGIIILRKVSTGELTQKVLRSTSKETTLENS